MSGPPHGPSPTVGIAGMRHAPVPERWESDHALESETAGMQGRTQLALAHREERMDRYRTSPASSARTRRRARVAFGATGTSTALASIALSLLVGAAGCAPARGGDGIDSPASGGPAALTPGDERSPHTLQGHEDGSRADTLPASVTREIDRVFAEYARDTTPGYAVAVLRDGRALYRRGHGMANLDDQRPITPATAFNIASLSKQFTAACVALLVLDGKVRLDDTAAAYVPELAKYHRHGGPPILVKHLIYMTSGLPEYYTVARGGGRSWDPYDQFTVADAIRAVLSVDTLQFAPGTRWAYSNINYMLLTRIVERASGIPFAEFADQRLFRPLGMTNTQVNADVSAVVPDRALGYNRRTGDAVAEARRAGRYLRAGSGRLGWLTHPRISPHYGGSGILSTLDDLARWDRNFSTMALGGPRFIELMLRRERFAHPKDNDAFGLVHGQYRGHPTLWYEGGDLGFSSYMLRFPGLRLTVLVLSNMGEGNSARYARAVADIVLATEHGRGPQ